MQWKPEIFFVKRNENGAIVAIEEKQPAAFKAPEELLQAQNRVTAIEQRQDVRYRVVGD